MPVMNGFPERIRAAIPNLTFSEKYRYTDTGCIHSISQPVACGTGFSYSQIKDRDTSYVSFYAQAH